MGNSVPSVGREACVPHKLSSDCRSVLPAASSNTFSIPLCLFSRSTMSSIVVPCLCSTAKSLDTARVSAPVTPLHNLHLNLFPSLRCLLVTTLVKWNFASPALLRSGALLDNAEAFTVVPALLQAITNWWQSVVLVVVVMHLTRCSLKVRKRSKRWGLLFAL